MDKKNAPGDSKPKAACKEEVIKTAAEVLQDTNNTMDQSMMDESLMGIVRQRSTRALDEILAEEAQEQEDSEEEGRARAPEGATSYPIQEAKVPVGVPVTDKIPSRNIDQESTDILTNPESQSVPGAHPVGTSFSAVLPEIDDSSSNESSTQEDAEDEVQVNVSTAYVVQEEEPTEDLESEATQEPKPAEATVLKTIFGIDQTRFVILVAVLLTLLAIVFGSVFGTFKNTKAEEPSSTCGPLCGSEELEFPDPSLVVLGETCKDWNLMSASLLLPGNDTCADKYQAAAFGCGCPDIQPPSEACGTFCQGGLPDPELVVSDIHGQELTCEDWQLKTQFNNREEECLNYQSVAALCGCETVPKPPEDTCGPLCGTDFTGDLPFPTRDIWGQTCEEWDILSTYLPEWYLASNVEGQDESCDIFYRDVAYRCGCPETELPPNECGALCQQRSTCGLMCQDGSPIPDPDLVVRDATCRSWEFHSRITPHEERCYFYNMVGAECGCKNEPPEESCGPLCGPGTSLPDPQKEVQGQTCGEWNGYSTFLYEGYGKASGAHVSMIESCSALAQGKVAFGCGCSGVEPPADGCGMLCPDGSPVPVPDSIVGNRHCGEWEIFSQFEKDPQTCNWYHTTIAPQCGCKIENATAYDCITLEDLSGQNLYKSIGGFHYTISFGEGGKFIQSQRDNAINLIGDFAGFGNDTKSNIASYGGGEPCGMYGPRRGSAVLVENPTVTEPSISGIIEPSICVYQAEIKVPNFCE